MNISKEYILRLPFNMIVSDVYPFKEVFASSLALDTPIHSILGNVTSGMFRSMHEVISTPGVGYYDLHDVFVTYDGCIFSDQILAPPASNVAKEHTLNVLNRHLNKEVFFVREIDHNLTCVLYGAGWTTWGHWLVDFFPRIFILEQAGINIKDIYWVLPKDVPNYVNFLLKVMGIKSDKIILFDHANEVLFFNKILMVPNLVSGMVVHPIMVDYVDWIKNKCKRFKRIDTNKKIFIARRHVTPNRILVNRDMVEDVVKSFGYEIFFPEAHTIRKQISEFSSSTHIAGENGSGLHSSIFAPSGAIITFLRSGLRSVGALQTSLVRAAGQKMSYVFGETESDRQPERYVINIDDLKFALEYADTNGI